MTGQSETESLPPATPPGHLATWPPGNPVIFLIGYRGTGKTTVARVLAEQLGWDWLDADATLEALHGRSIRQMFQDEEEAGFRAKEAALLELLCRLRRHVIATGGGIVLREENRTRMRTTGRIVWLRAEAETIWQRLQADATTFERRPTLTAGGRAEIDELLRAREALYQSCADLIVETDQRSPESVAAVIRSQWNLD